MLLRHLSLLFLIFTGFMSAIHAAETSFKPVFADGVLENTEFQVGCWVETRPQLISDIAGVTFKVRGLPTGLACNLQNGVISGYPQKPGDKKIQIVATHSSKAFTTATATLTVSAFPENLTGDFQALLSAIGAESSPESWGGLLTVNVALHGSFSGKLVLGNQTRSFKGVLTHHYSSGYEAAVTLTESLQLQLQVNDAGFLVGTLHDSATNTDVAFTAAPRAWSKKAPSLWAKGAYTMHIQAVTGSPTSAPCGDGYLLATVNADGSVLLKGALADGTAITASGLLLKQNTTTNQILVHLPLYPAKAQGSKIKSPFGAFRGALNLSVVTPEELKLNPAPDARFTSNLEPLTWQKKPSGLPRDSLYPDGFSLDIEVEGRRYLKPGKKELLLQSSPGKRNALLRVYPIGYTHSIPLMEHSFTLTASHQFQPFSNPDSGLAGFKLNLNAATGLFYGSFHNGASGDDRQTGKFAGAILTFPGTSYASGHLLWTTMASPAHPQSAHSYLLALESQQPLEMNSPGSGIAPIFSPGSGVGGISGSIGPPHSGTAASANAWSGQPSNDPAPLTGGVPGSANTGSNGYTPLSPIPLTGTTSGSSVTTTSGSSWTGGSGQSAIHGVIQQPSGSVGVNNSAFVSPRNP